MSDIKEIEENGEGTAPAEPGIGEDLPSQDHDIGKADPEGDDAIGVEDEADED